jgi:adenylosuccinate synthase
LQQVPAGFVNPDVRLLIAPGALVNPEVFLREVELCGLGPDRISIDENAGVIESIDLDSEKSLDLPGRLGSTGEGVGSAVSRRALRAADFQLAGNHPDLAPFTKPVWKELGEAVRCNKSIVIEGTQGFGLSLYHADEWPYRTSRDTTAHSFLGEVGLGARDYEVIMAIRTYPIRVAGESGHLPNEVTWEEVHRDSGYPYPIAEYTTTTKRLRRVGEFDWSVVERAVLANAPTQIALHGADYIDYANYAKSDWADLTGSAREFVNMIENRVDVPVTFVGTGPTNHHIIDRRGVVRPADAATAVHTPAEMPV